MSLAFEASLFTLRSDFLHAIKFYDMGQRLYFTSEGSHATNFLSPSKIHRPRPG
jgi:hypothetical protein